MIALALLIGCDYCPRGLVGVGKQSALKYVQLLPRGSAALERYLLFYTELNVCLRVRALLLRTPREQASDSLMRLEDVLSKKVEDGVHIPFDEIVEEFIGEHQRRASKCVSLHAPKCPRIACFQVSVLPGHFLPVQ